MSGDGLGPGCYCPPANVGEGIKPQPECPVHDYLAEHPATEDEKRAGCVYGNREHDCHDDCTGSPDRDRWNERTRHWYCPRGNDNCGAHPPAEPDAGEAEGLALLLRQTARAHIGAGEGDYWPSGIADAQARVVLASDWLAAHDRQVKAEAWDEGRRFGQVHWSSNYWPEVKHRPDPNPYRADRIARGEAGR